MWVDRLAVAVLSTVAQLGLYQASSQLSMVPMMLATTITAVHEVDIARARSRVERTRVFVRAQLFQIHLVAAGCLAGMLTAPTWLSLLFGAEFSDAGAVLVLLLAGQLARAFGVPTVNVLNMAGAPELALRLTGAGLVLNLLLNVALIGPLGAVGAAAATLVATLAVTGAATGACLRRRLIRFRLHPLSGPAISVAGLFVLALPVKLIAPAGTATDLAVTAIAFAGYFAPMAVGVGYHDDDEIAGLLNLRRRLAG